MDKLEFVKMCILFIKTPLNSKKTTQRVIEDIWYLTKDSNLEYKNFLYNSMKDNLIWKWAKYSVYLQQTVSPNGQ